jgi:hypothetical protein
MPGVAVHKPLTRQELGVLIKTRMPGLMVDASGTDPAAFAIYTLADPRDLRHVRYVGQTRLPRRRLLQHLSAARLWLPDERPWWFDSPELRPLYDWIRELHRDQYRLPAMLISSWAGNAMAARRAERELILKYLSENHDLLNVERELLGRQMLLSV